MTKHNIDSTRKNNNNNNDNNNNTIDSKKLRTSSTGTSSNDTPSATHTLLKEIDINNVVINNTKCLVKTPGNDKITKDIDRSTCASVDGTNQYPCIIKTVTKHNEVISITPSPMTCPQSSYCCLPSPPAQHVASTTAATTTNATITTTTKKRTDYICWDDYFMAVAIVSSYRSKDPVHPTGACIVDMYNHIIGIGYNGFPTGCSDDILPWNSSIASQQQDRSIPDMTKTTDLHNKSEQQLEWLHTPLPYVVHAEVNAILNQCSQSPNCNNTRIYTQYFPCNECAKVIIQSRIKEIIYLYDDDNKNNPTKRFCSDSLRASRIMLSMAGIQIRKYTPVRSVLKLQFYNSLSDDERTSFLRQQTQDAKKGSDDIVSNQVAVTFTDQEHRNLMLREANYDVLFRGSTKSNTYISWDDYFMTIAFLTAQRSKDPNTQVGACIVDTNHRIVGLGYNGFPTGCSDDCLPWSRGDEILATPTTTKEVMKISEIHKKYAYVVHAEVNAILNKGSADVRGSTIYVALFPCNDCSKVIIQAGIQEVVYMSDRYHNTDSCIASRILLQMAGVTLRKYIPTVPTISIDMNNSSI